MLIVLLIIWAACAFIGHQIAKPKGYPVAGIVLGLLLGLIGIIIILFLPNKNLPFDGQKSGCSTADSGPSSEQQRLFG